ncbi:DUF4190 domain-containing protein [Microbacterium sp. NPDC055988]|uniref:DUF4190 domain-containing protein n=1 Tax=Microbacterium sp. NPDC055988 TaxID=3345671 RepID=UPI0035DA3BCA
MTNPPFPEQPNPDSSVPETPPPPPAAAAPATTGHVPSAPTPDWNTAPDGVPGTGVGSPADDHPAPADAAYSAPPAADYPAPGAAVYGQPTSAPPGRVLSIVGFVLAFVVAPVGLIISIVAAVKLGKSGQPKGFAIAGIIVGALITIFWVILLIVLFTAFAALIGMCADLGPGVWEVDGITYRCG